MTNDYRARALECVIREAAQENLGIYPQSIVGGPNAYEKRSDWHEGWNAAVMAYTKHASKIEDWLDALPAEHRPLVEDLLLDGGRLQISCPEDDDKPVSLWVLCNDVFFWGCADGEGIELSDLPALAECCKLSPKWGGELWACRKREMRPQTACYRECYPETEWSLFDACGPARDDSDGKGRDKLTWADAQAYREKRACQTPAP